MSTLAYLSTPYTLYDKGLTAAYRDACKLAARLIASGVHVFSPIAHSHGIAIHGHIDPLNQQLWLEHCRTMLHKCDKLLVAHLDGWQESTGIQYETELFTIWGREIFDLDPVSLRMEKRKREAA